ncbi:MAG: hypothetical protein QXW77_03760 [Candidatus Hadarchaeales archaeon]
MKALVVFPDRTIKVKNIRASRAQVVFQGGLYMLFSEAVKKASSKIGTQKPNTEFYVLYALGNPVPLFVRDREAKHEKLPSWIWLQRTVEQLSFGRWTMPKWLITLLLMGMIIILVAIVA